MVGLIEMKADGTLVDVIEFATTALAAAFLDEAIRDFGARPERVVIWGPAASREVNLAGLFELLDLGSVAAVGPRA